MAAMFSNVRTGKRYFSLFPIRNKMIVKGTKIISETSFVTNIEEKNTQKTKKKERLVIPPIFSVIFNRGLKICSFLNPSRTVNNMKRVARVLQSISYRSFNCGGVMKREMTAAKSDTESIISFLKIKAILLMIFEGLFFIFKDSIIFLNKIKVCPLFSVFSKKIRSVPVVPVVKNKNKVCPHCKKNRGHTSLHSNKNRDRPCRTALFAKMQKIHKMHFLIFFKSHKNGFHKSQKNSIMPACLHERLKLFVLLVLPVIMTKPSEK